MYVPQFSLILKLYKLQQSGPGRNCIVLPKANLTRRKRPRFIYLFAGLVPQHGARDPETHRGVSNA